MPWRWSDWSGNCLVRCDKVFVYHTLYILLCDFQWDYYDCITGSHTLVAKYCLHVFVLQTVHGIWMEDIQESAVQHQASR